MAVFFKIIQEIIANIVGFHGFFDIVRFCKASYKPDSVIDYSIVSHSSGIVIANNLVQPTQMAIKKPICYKNNLPFLFGFAPNRVFPNLHYCKIV